MAKEKPYRHGLYLPQPFRATDYHKRHSPTAQALCREIRNEQGSRLSSFIPSSFCQELPRPLQRHCPPCRPYGTREHRNHTHLPSPHRQRATENCGQGGELVILQQTLEVLLVTLLRLFEYHQGMRIVLLSFELCVVALLMEANKFDNFADEHSSHY